MLSNRHKAYLFNLRFCFRGFIEPNYEGVLLIVHADPPRFPFPMFFLEDLLLELKTEEIYG